MITVDTERPARRRGRLRSLALVFGTLGMSVLIGFVTPAQQANALRVPGPPVELPGAVRTIAPKALGFSNPVGWVITGAQVGYELFDHREGIAGFSADAWSWMTGGVASADQVPGSPEESCLLAANRARCGLPDYPKTPSPPGAVTCSFPVTTNCALPAAPTTGHKVNRNKDWPTVPAGYCTATHAVIGNATTSPYAVDLLVMASGNSACIGSNGFSNGQSGISDAKYVIQCLRANGTTYKKTNVGNSDVSFPSNHRSGNPADNTKAFENGVLNVNGCYETRNGVNVADQLVSLLVWDAGTDNNFSNFQPFSWINDKLGDLVGSLTTTTVERTCRFADGTTTVVSRTGPAGARYMTVGACPEGSVPVGIDVSADVGGVGQKQSLFSSKITEADIASYAECIGVGKSCGLVIHKDGAPCSYSDAECRTWKAQVDGGATRFQCRWGPYTLTIDQCNPVANGYLTESGLVRDDKWRGPADAPLPAGNPDGSVYRQGIDNPTWKTIPDMTAKPSASATAAPTAQPSASSSASATATPTVSAPPTVIPTTGVNPPPPDPEVLDPRTGSSCLSEGWTWNPISWVYTPVKCVLIWAFVPPPNTFTNAISSTKTELVARPPVSIVPAIAAPITGLVSGAMGGCGGSLANFGGGLVIPCSPGGAGWATTLYGVASVGIVVATCFSAWRMVDTALSKQGTS